MTRSSLARVNKRVFGHKPWGADGPKPVRVPAPLRDNPHLRKSYSRMEITRSLKLQIERDGGTFLSINLKKNNFSWLDTKGTKHTAQIEYA